MSDHPYVPDAAEWEADRELDRGDDDKERCHACDAVLLPEELAGDDPDKCPCCGEVL